MSESGVLSRNPSVSRQGTRPVLTSRTTAQEDEWVNTALGVPMESTSMEDESEDEDQTDPQIQAPVNVAVVTDIAQSQALAINAQLGEAGDDDDIEALKEVLARHSQCIPAESKTFRLGGGWVQHIDDLARIPKPEARQAKVNGIKDVLNAVAQRRTDLLAAIRAVAAKPNPSDEVKGALAMASTTLHSLTMHLPAYFQDPYVERELQRRLKTLASTPEEKAQLLEKAKLSFVDPDGNPKLDANGKPVGDGLRAAFKETIDKIGTRDFDRQNFYFDAITTAISPEDGKRLYEANDRLVEQGQLILDTGGTLRDVQAMLSKTGVPEDWWPPRLVESLQAWRKTERAMQEERVSQLVEQKKPDFSTTEGIMSFFLSEMPELGSKVCEFFKHDEIAEATKGLLDGIKSGFDTGAVGFAALESLDFDELEPTTRQKLLDGLEKGMSVLEGALNSTCAVLGIAKDLGADHLASAIPGLSIAACGVNLALAIKKLGEHTAIRVQTGMMKGEAFKALGNADITDGGAFIQALGNEINGRNKQITKDGIEVTTSSMDLAGSIAGTFGGHYGLIAKGALKITSTAITYGSKVVFTNIDWSEADRAKALLKEAQAGNPVARIQIFEESNLYAKMYICVLCRDKVSLALKFVDQRGIEESDLSTPMSLKILREALLASADQKDENDIDDSRVMENLGKIGKGLKAIGSGAKALGSKAKEATKDRKPIYSPILLPFDPDTALTEAGWRETKKVALKAGLYDEETGVGDAMANFQSALKKITETITAGVKLDPTTKAGKTAQENFLATLAALRGVIGALDRCEPTQNPDGEKAHPEMAAYIVAALKKARTQYNVLDAKMSELGLKDAGWTPRGIGAPLNAAAWKANWADAVVKACLPKEDGGVADGLDALAKAEAAILANAKDPAEQRKARLKAADVLNDLIGACKQAWAQARGVPAMLTEVDRTLKATGARRIEIDQALAPTVWSGMPPVDKPVDVTAPKWKAFWASAVKAGVALPDDGGLLSALQTLDTRAQAVADAATGKPKLKARIDFGIAVGKVIVAERKLLSTQRDICKPLKDYIQNIHLRALQLQAAFSEQRDQIAFLVVGGTTVAGWTQTYANATNVGALPPAKSGAKAFEKSLGEYETAYRKMQTAVTGKKFGDALKQATLARQALNEADKAVWQKLQTADGYSSNKQMGPYLEKLRKDIADYLKDGELTAALGGRAKGAAFVAGPFTMDASAWDKIKKSAVSNGVLIDSKTGVTDALNKCKKSLASLIAENTAKKPDQKKIDKARATAVEDANRLVAVTGSLGALAPDSTAWQDYAKAAKKFAEDHLTNVTNRKS